MSTVEAATLRGAIEAAAAAGELDDLRTIELDEIVTAMRLGVIVNQWDAQGDPVEIRSDEQYSGAFLDLPVPTARVDAAVLREALRASDGVDPRGLRLHRSSSSTRRSAPSRCAPIPSPPTRPARCGSCSAAPASRPCM